ncbi:MAG: VanZ family protein [Candidatus Latescibacterota bacterium]|nr:MAG: VanZ family protein [Candidatus Latescibacterota bacterium]
MFQNQRRLYPVLIYVLLIFAVSSFPSLKAPGPSFALKDKIAHTAEYFVLGLLLFRGVGWTVSRSRTATLGFLVSVGVSVAALDEIYQSFIPGRMMSVYDWYADALGVVIGVGLFMYAARRDRSRSEDGKSEWPASEGKPT